MKARGLRPAPTGSRRVRLTPAPERHHPLVRRLFEEMQEQQVCVPDVSERSGIAPGTIKNWKWRAMPPVDSLDACLNVLGLKLAVVRMRHDDLPATPDTDYQGVDLSRLPAAIRAGLSEEALRERFGVSNAQIRAHKKAFKLE